MPSIQLGEKTIGLDEEGYLLDRSEWSPEVACALALRSGLEACELTPERMRILEFLRDYHARYEGFPVVGYVCSKVGQPRECQYQEFLDPIQAWRIAGLPRPTTEVLALVRHGA